MWVAKIKFSTEGTLLAATAKKFNLDMFGFPLSYSYEKNHIVVHVAGTMIGTETNKKDFLKALKESSSKHEANRGIVNFEVNKDFIIGTIKEPLYVGTVYRKDIIHVAPIFISSKGYEILTIGSFKKEPLLDVYKTFSKRKFRELISIQNKKVKSISVLTVHPELTDKQKQAITLAIKHGYYHSPRKIDLQSLAKMAKLSFATYQVHLRKAEEKLIPYSFE